LASTPAVPISREKGSGRSFFFKNKKQIKKLKKKIDVDI
jgi:hypothetical protein